MAYEFKVDNQLVRLRFIGDFDEADLERYIQDFDPLRDAVSPDAPLQFLIDAGEMGTICAKARQDFTARNGDPRIGKVAILGFNRFLKVLISFILKVSGRDNVQFFNSEAEALTWLKNSGN